MPFYIFIMRSEGRMPKIFEYNGYKFFFFSNEGIPREPCRIHVRKGETNAKFWVIPYVSLASSYEMTSKELMTLQVAVQEHVELIRRKWDEHFGG
jgi:hypothetical protein